MGPVEGEKKRSYGGFVCIFLGNYYYFDSFFELTTLFLDVFAMEPLKIVLKLNLLAVFGGKWSRGGFVMKRYFLF